jgi:hypothetical protein
MRAERTMQLRSDQIAQFAHDCAIPLVSPFLG